MQCTYIKPDGSQCKGYAMENQEYCWFHNPQVEKNRRAASSIGGKAYSTGLHTPLPPVNTDYYRDTTDLLIETLNQFREGKISTRSAVALAHFYRLLREWLYKDADYRNGSGFLLRDIGRTKNDYDRQQNGGQDEELEEDEDQYQDSEDGEDDE